MEKNSSTILDKSQLFLKKKNTVNSLTQIQDQSIKNVQKTVDFETKTDSSRILHFF